MSRAPSAHERVLLLACVGLWCVAAALTHVIGVWPAMGGASILLGGAMLLADGTRVRPLLRSQRWRDAGIALVLGISLGVAMTWVIYRLYAPFTAAYPLLIGNTARLYGAFAGLSLLRASLLLVPVIVGEELVWRGTVQTTLQGWLGTPVGAVAALGCYALAHAATGSPVLVMAALGCGLVWSGLRAITGGLLAPIIAHLIWDFSVLVIHPIVPIVRQPC